MDRTTREISDLVFSTILLSIVFIIAYQWNFVLAFLIGSFGLMTHELGHRIVGRLRGNQQARFTMMPLGISIGFITSLFFGHALATPGGVTLGDETSPVDRLMMALGGPYMNFFLFAVFMGIHGWHDLLGIPQTVTFEAGYIIGATDHTVQIWFVIAVVNLLLGTFNLLPIPGFDGSHVLSLSPLIWGLSFSFGVLFISIYWTAVQGEMNPLFQDTWVGVFGILGSVDFSPSWLVAPVIPGLLWWWSDVHLLPDWILETHEEEMEP